MIWVEAEELFGPLGEELPGEVAAGLEMGVATGSAPTAGRKVHADEPDRICSERLATERTSGREAGGSLFNNGIAAAGAENMPTGNGMGHALGAILFCADIAGRTGTESEHGASR